MLKLTNADNGGNAEVRVGELFELQLSENPTTGYRWQLHPPVGPFLKVEDDSFAVVPGALGSGGLHNWRFTAVQEGLARLEIENRRSWETQSVGTFTVAIEVKAP